MDDLRALDRARARDDADVDVIEVWWTDPSAACAGLLRWELRPATATSNLVAAVVGTGRAPAVVSTSDLPVPLSGLEARAAGVWVDLVCETPLDHWTVGLEAFGVTVEPGEPVSPEVRGDRTPVGLDLDLDTVAPGPTATAVGLAVPLRVHGEVLVADEALDLDVGGVRFRGDPAPLTHQAATEVVADLLLVEGDRTLARRVLRRGVEGAAWSAG